MDSTAIPTPITQITPITPVTQVTPIIPIFKKINDIYIKSSYLDLSTNKIAPAVPSGLSSKIYEILRSKLDPSLN